MKLLCLTLSLITFVVGAYALAYRGHWILGLWCILCAASCRQKSEALP